MSDNDRLNERDLFGNPPEPMTLSEWAFIFGFLTVVTLTGVAVIRFIIGLITG